MANEHRTRKDSNEHEPAKPRHSGDVLGLGDARPDVEIPRATEDRGGHPEGIDVRGHATGIGDLHQGPGATGIDMGHAGEGTQISSEPKRPRAALPEDEDDSR